MSVYSSRDTTVVTLGDGNPMATHEEGGRPPRGQVNHVGQNAQGSKSKTPKVFEMPLDLSNVHKELDRPSASVTERPGSVVRNTARFAGEALTERSKKGRGNVRRHVGVTWGVGGGEGKVSPVKKERKLPPWFRGTRKGGGLLTSEQSLNCIVRRELVSREGTGQREWEKSSWTAWEARQKSVLGGVQEPDNFAVYHRRWAADADRVLLPLLKSSSSQVSRTRTNSSQLFRSHDPVDEWTFGISRLGSGAAGYTADAKIKLRGTQRQGVKVLTEENTVKQQDKLGLPLAFLQKPRPSKSRLETSSWPGTNSRPVTDYRPNTQGRMARRAKQQRKDDMPEPAPDTEIDPEDRIDTTDVMNRLVKVASTGSQDLIDSHVLDVLGECAQLCRQSRYLDAERLYRAVIQYSPQNGTAMCNLGVIVERVHDNPALASQLYRQALEISGEDDITTLIHLARCEYRVTSDIIRPRGLLQKVLAIDPRHSGALSCMALLLLSEWARSNAHLQQIQVSDVGVGLDDPLPRAIVTVKKSNAGPLLSRSMSIASASQGITAWPGGISRTHKFNTFSESGPSQEVTEEAISGAMEAVKLAESFFWKAHDSANTDGDHASMALALGNIATINKIVFKDMEKAEQVYKRAIKCDPRHPILRRNFARLYHDFFDDTVQTLNAVVRGKATGDLKSQRQDRTAAQLGAVAETEYRAALHLIKGSMAPKELSSRALKLDLCLNLAALLCEDAMGQRWQEARVLYKMAVDCDSGSVQAALGCAAILWERENKLQDARMILSTALEAASKTQKYKSHHSKIRRAVGVMGKFNAVKADHIVVQKTELVASLMHSSNYMNLAHFEASTWELKSSSVYNNLEKFGAGSVFDTDDSIEWATGGVEKNVGEWVYVKYQVPYIVSMVKVKQRKVFAQMVRRLDIYFEGGENRQILLLPEIHEQEFFINPPVLTRLVRFEISQVYGEAVTGLNTLQVFGQHRSAADLTLKYDMAASKLQKLKEQTQHLAASQELKQQKQLLYESKVLHAKMMLASDDTHIRAEGATAIVGYFSTEQEHNMALPHVFSSALAAYGAYVQTRQTAVQQHYTWLPFSSTDTPREQGEKLFILAIETFAANADAQLRLASSYAQRLAECPVEERQNWCTKVELNFQVALVKDPQNVMALYQYALFLEEHLADLNQAVELYRRAARCFCANKHLQASVMCSLATALQRRGRLHIDSQVNIFSVREEEEEADKQGGGGGITQLNDLDEAAVWYERCLAVSPRSVACLCNFGMLQLFRNYPNKALKYFSRAIHMEPYNARALTAYAAVLDDVGMPINVVERMYMRAVQQDPDHVTALNGLGTVAHRQQKLAEAEIYYQRALTVDPSNDDVAENLEILREATYAHQGPKTPDRSKLHRERSQLSSRNDSRLPSRSGGLSPRMPSRGGLPPSPRATLQSRGRGFEDSTPSRLSSRDGPSYLHDRPCRSRRPTPNHVATQDPFSTEISTFMP